MAGEGLNADTIEARLRECLDANDLALRAGLRSALIERDFPPHARHRGGPAPAPPLDADGDRLLGVRIIYGFGVWEPTICGLSRTGGWKCRARRLLSLGGRHLFQPIAEELDAFDGEQEVEGDALGALQEGLVKAWVRRAWLLERSAAPELRGFVSEHDTIYMMDLDSGEVVRESEIGLGYL